LMFALLLLTGTSIFAQTIEGVVQDETGPLPGATVVEKGTSNGVTTDFDGKFSLKVKQNKGVIKISFVGMLTKEVSFNASSNEIANLGNIILEQDENILDEVVISAVSFAIDRKTPVAVSTVTADIIEHKLGTQEFPEILKSTPGVYATKSGGGYGDGRINLRGFSSENIGVLINGAPVNDMENGRVYWSNWAGLGDVTKAMQVQRGLGASKVAVPSVGGTINILTKSTDAKKGGVVRMSIGNDGYTKYGFTLSTGLMDNGFAATISAAKLSGDGYVDGTEFDGFNYFLNLSKELNDKHKLSFTVFGAKQEHGQRYNRRTIEQYRATESGPKRFNPDWGYRNGKVEHTSYNFYHKPQMSLNHDWIISDKTFVTTAIYASFGKGGGRRPQGTKFVNDDYRLGGIDQPIGFDRIVQENKDNGALGTTDFFAASRNSHKWYGILSTLKTDLSENLTLSGGLDARYYIGSHWYEVSDLMGGQFFINTNKSDNTYNQALKVGDRFNKDYDSKVVRAGVFAQFEYSVNDLSLFLSSAVSNTSYSKEDFMRYAPTDPKRESETANFLGYSIKGGANYNISETSNVFANIGYFSKAPFLTGNVFLSTSSTDLNPDALNEKVFSTEVGYGYRGSKLSGNINVYRTSWIDKSLTGTVFDPSNPDVRQTYNIPGLDALHQGVEVDFTYKLSDKLKMTGMVSIGDWQWKNDASGTIFDEAGDPIKTIDVLAKDLKVSDAAQTTYALGLNYDILEKSSIYLDYNYAGNYYASYSINRVNDSRENSWKLPSFHLFDLGLRHGFEIANINATIYGRINNLFNVEYISDARGGQGEGYETASVYYGTGRTFSVGLKINF